ncbi:MAG: GNAT family protein [Chloroflexota bacterium]
MFLLSIDKEITVRTFHPDDAEELFNLLERNRSRLRPWIHPTALPETPRATRKFTIECYFGSLDPMVAIDTPYIDEVGSYFPPFNPAMEMGIWVNGSLAGEVALSWLNDSPAVAEFGYWLAEDFERKGIITRCVRALMDHTIDHMDIEQFLIGSALNNQRSRAVPERLGYRLHATVPNGEVVGEFIYDRVVYGIRSTAWRQQNKADVHNE